MWNNQSDSLSKIISFSREVSNQLYIEKDPQSLYAPINYISQKKGKQIRSIFALLTYDMFGGRINDLRELILAIESLHNFTLIHDDVMDNATIRRGVETINKKWSNNQAILSGDVLLMQAYKYLLDGQQNNSNLLKDFTDTAILICEGQQLDFDLQLKRQLKNEDYFKMIELKTGVLITFSLTAPLIMMGLEGQDIKIMNRIGYTLGHLFQIQDDYLDLYGESSRVGKLIGGDILESKKTFLYITAFENATSKQKKDLEDIYHINSEDKINTVLETYNKLGVQKFVQQRINKLNSSLKELVNQLSVQDEKKVIFREFIDIILERNY